MNYYKKILNVFEALKKSHPEYIFGKHIATIVSEHEVWGLDDKQFFMILKEHQDSLELDHKHNENDIEEIIKGGLSLNVDDLYGEEQEWQ